MDDSRSRMGTSSYTLKGDYFALLSVDGRLRIWDTTSGKVVQEFSPNSVTQSSCTCLCWTKGTFTCGEKKKLKRKLKRKKVDGGIAFDSLAIGTDKGFLFCYNPITGEVEKLNKDGHIDKVNCITYHEKEATLYSCSDDKYIIQWCSKNYLVKSKWKADKRGVKRICMGPSGTTLLSAGCSIKLWNLETKDLLQEFHGHSSPISLLQFAPYKQNAKEDSFDDGYYFVSGSTEDRVINAWQINSKSPDMTAVASFIISDIAVFMDIILDEDDNQPIKLCVGCKDGRIHFFTCTMNGRTSKPIESTKTVDYLTKEGGSIPFINGRLLKANGVNLNLVYGHILNLSFTSLCYAELDMSSKIEKEIKKNLLLSEINKGRDESVELAATSPKKFVSDTSVLSIATNSDKIVDARSTVKGDVTAQPMETVTSSPTAAVDMNGDIEQTEITEEEMSMEERLKLTHPDSKKFVVKMKPKGSAPNAGSFAQMLIQALHSNDEKLLHEMLFQRNYSHKVLTNTVKRIPNDLVGTLLKTLADLLLYNPKRSAKLVGWLRTIMSVHLTFLLTSDVSRSALAGIYRLVKIQEDIHMPLLNLQGKIDMLSSYVSGSYENDGREDLSTAAVVYDDSDEDETDEDWVKAKKIEMELKGIADSDGSDEDTDGVHNDTEGTGIESDADMPTVNDETELLENGGEEEEF